MLRDYPKFAAVGVDVFLQQIERIRREDKQSLHRIENYALNNQRRFYSISSASSTFDASYGVALVDYTAIGVVNVDLPDAASMVQRVIIIKDSAGQAGANNITVTPNAGEFIDGAATATINNNYGTLELLSDGANWWLL